MNATRAVPRAYLWGFADTVHAGMEGRLAPQLIFGHMYPRKGPKYFFPAMIAVKLPIGLGALSVLGLIFFLARRLPKQWDFEASVILASSLLFLLVLTQGATYAGVRHTMPVIALMAIFAGLLVQKTLTTNSRSLKTIVFAAYVLAAASALPLMRPWEYFNEFVGGARNAHNYFNDEGVDLALYFHGIAKLYAEKPDLSAAEQAFRKSLELDSAAFFVNIELGNVLLKRGAREGALRAYSDALKYAPEDTFVRQAIEKQIARFSGPASVDIPVLRNPFLE